ncbi:MAG: inositol monophosphatase family protein [Hyphomicrobiaceae bacterium]
MAAIDIDKVSAIVREVAATEVMPRWRNLGAGDISSKSHAGDLVTVADRAAEAALSQRLTALLPGSLIIGEEGVHADPTILERFRDDAYVWVLDPIDGTRAFSEGREPFDVMVGLVRRGRPVAGWILAPVSGVLHVGEVGAGARRQAGDSAGEPVARRELPAALGELQGVLGVQGFLNRKLPSPEGVRDRFKGYTKPVSAGQNYARLLTGDADFLINFLTLPWDHMAGLAITEAAGMFARRHDGAHFDPLDTMGGVLVAPDAASWREILALLVPHAKR